MNLPVRAALAVLVLQVVLAGGTASAQSKPAANAQGRAEALDAGVKRDPAKLEAAIKRDPGNAGLYVALGLAYWDRNDSDRAFEAFRRAVKVDPRSAEAHNWLGVALADKADLPDAIASLRKAVALDPKYGRAYTNLGSALAKSGDFGEAVEVFEKALALEPNRAGAHMNLGLALREKGDLDKALVHLRRVATADPKNAAIHYELGQTLRQTGDLAGAIASFERALAIAPELREGYYALGLALKQLSASARKPPPSKPSPADDLYKSARESFAGGDLDAATKQLTEALRLDDGHAEAHDLLGFVLGQRGNLPSALDHLNRAVALRPESAGIHYNLGVALWYAGSKEKAIGELRESVKLDPAAGASYAFLGMAERETGSLAAAHGSLQRAIALLPPTAAVYVDLGITLLRTGHLDLALGQFVAALNAPSSSPEPEWDAAIDGIRQALASTGKRPDRAKSARGASTRAADDAKTGAEAHNALGLLLGRKAASSSDVAAEFREAIRLQPDYAEAHNNLGLVLIQAGDDAAGIAALREAIRISPDYAAARANLGAALTPTDPDEAIRELERAVALAPNSVKAQFNLAVAYGSSSSAGSAKEIEQLRKVIGMAPEFARAHLALGKALLQTSNPADAVQAMQEAARLEPANGEAHYQLGLALARAGRKEEATAELQKGRELIAVDDRIQNASLDIAEGRAAMENGELDQAAGRFRHALQLVPDSAEARSLLAKVLDASANPAPARPPSASGVDDQKRITELEAYIRGEQYKEVEPLLADYVKERPKSAWGWYALGYSRFAQQKIGESIQALAKSLEIDVTNSEAHKILGRNLMIAGRFDAARIEFEQGLRYKPDSAELHYNLGKLQSIQDNWEPARKALEDAIRIDPSYIEAIDALGFALEALGDDAGAVANYEKAVALNEQRRGRFSSGYVNLSAYYNRAGEPAKALDYARKAIDLDPKSDRAWFQKGRADEREGRLDDAVEAVNKAISLNARASSYYYVLAGLYRRLGRMDESRKALESFTRLEQETKELERMRRGGGKDPIIRQEPPGE